MKKLTFKVTLPKDDSIVSIIKAVHSIPCRIYLDLENGLIDIEDINDAMIDSVIELVDNYYTILGVEIDNTLEESTEEQVVPIVAESTADATDDAVEKTIEETVEEVAEETAEAVAEEQKTFLEPQSEDDLIIKKVEFENKYVENLINKLLRTAYWAMFTMNIPEKEIGDFIYTCMNELSMKYNKKGCIEFSVGDIVDCNYGYHLNGEINGTHVSAIVCNISDEGMVYLVPITKKQTNISSYSYAIFNVPDDVIYENDYYKGGTALLDKGKYVRPERLHAVIGKTTEDFFEQLLSQLAYTFDFINYPSEADEDPTCLEEGTTTETEKTTTETIETVSKTDNSAASVVENPSAAEETVAKIDPSVSVLATKSSKNVGNNESTLLEIIGFALDKLDSSKKLETQIEAFLTDIGMTTTEKMVKQSFIIACDIKKINYENVILRLHELNPKIRMEIIQTILKESFKNWLKQYPNLVEKCPRISFMSVLKVFAKRFS